MKKILITGGSGFIGSFVVEEALRQGLETWVAVRRTSSREYLRDERIRFIEPNLGNYTELCRQLEEHKREHGAFDYVVHCAGVTKCADEADFERVNTGHTENLVNALRQTGMVPRRLVYLSSLSVMGPVNDHDYRPISQDDEPQPNTAYARSKLKAERFLQEQKDFPCVILRPTGVYGPREKDYFLMAQSIARHVDCSVGFRRQDLTFVYVKDVVEAVFLAIERGRTGAKYFLSDGCVYSSRTFSDLIIRELGNPWVARIKALTFLYLSIFNPRLIESSTESADNPVLLLKSSKDENGCFSLSETIPLAAPHEIGKAYKGKRSLLFS